MLGWALCGLLLTAGCGDGISRGNVKGKVTFDGVPVLSGTIVFVPAEGTDAPSSGAAIEAGEYITTPDLGPAVGKYRVEITAHRVGETIEVAGAAGATSGPSGGGKVDKMEMYIPAKYNTNSELTYEVTPGENVKDFDLQAD